MPAAASNDIGLDYRITQRWDTGFMAELTLTNEASWTIPHWRMHIPFTVTITSIWNASLLSQEAGQYLFGAASWDDGDLSPGERVVIGFVANGSAQESFDPVLLNGSRLHINGKAPAPPAPVTTTPSSIATMQWPKRVFAPYLDVTAWPELAITEVVQQVPGLKFLRLGFVVATGTTDPRPSWGGVRDIALQYRLSEINTLRAKGGDVAIAFGGAAGTELAVAATSPEQLREAYRLVIDTYHVRVCDFDIEGSALANEQAILRRSQALAELQGDFSAHGRALEIWFTLPALPTGLTPEGLRIIRVALKAGIKVQGINLMAMDYGSAIATQPGQMGTYATQAATNAHKQLGALYNELGIKIEARSLWHSLGVTPMLGRNDVANEIFTLSDADQLLSFAQSKALGLLSFWSLNRDRACATTQSSARPDCSGTLQNPYAFSRKFRLLQVPSSN